MSLLSLIIQIGLYKTSELKVCDNIKTRESFHKNSDIDLNLVFSVSERLFYLYKGV